MLSINPADIESQKFDIHPSVTGAQLQIVDWGD